MLVPPSRLIICSFAFDAFMILRILSFFRKYWNTFICSYNTTKKCEPKMIQHRKTIPVPICFLSPFYKTSRMLRVWMREKLNSQTMSLTRKMLCR